MAKPAPDRQLRAQTFLPLVAAGVLAILTAQIVGHDPRYLAALVGVSALTVAPAFVRRWRMRKLLMSGDVERLIGTWEGAVRGAGPARETMTRLLRATAYAAYGWIDPARRSLERAERGTAWVAAFEQRLFIETLLDTFEGDREAAVRKATTLEHLPIPPVGPFARRRVVLLRRGLVALARAFAHTSKRSDARALARAAAASPLVHWAMRYAAAVVAVDHGRSRDVAALLSGAPSWPTESAFRAFHDELLARAALLA